jgi:PKD repeat protein
VSLTASNAGGSNTATKASYITVSVAAPVAGFSASPTSGVAPLTVSFTDQSTGQPTSWRWDFGDGASSTAQSPSHVYASAGTYTVSLTASNASGSDTLTWAGCISVSAAPAPIVDFTASPTSGSPPLTVTFTDESTVASSASAMGMSSAAPSASWHWEFGDGQTSEEENPVHVYRTGGGYTVSLTVTTETGSVTQTKVAFVVVAFSDTPPSYWAYREILACVRAGIIAGYLDGRFRPTWKVTRDQMAVYLARALTGGDANVPAGPSRPSFSDVSPDYWAYRHIEYIKGANIILGYPNGTYRPNGQVNRGEAAVFFARSLVSPTGEEGLKSYVPPARPTFRDVTPTNSWAWCYKHVEFLVSQGVAFGYADGRYHPGDTLSRDQVAVYLVRAFHLPL